ncbi:MAG: hypothetical protein ACREL3_10055 [Gemmatimonadales bacterium]
MLAVVDIPRCVGMIAGTFLEEEFDVLMAHDGYLATGVLSRPDHNIRLLIVDT